MQAIGGWVTLGWFAVAPLVLAWRVIVLHRRWRATAHMLELARARLCELEPVQWSHWWLRNASEMTPLDPRRPHFLRLAVAATLAPSLAQFRADLHSIAKNEAIDGDVRSAARGFLDDFTQAAQGGKPPWELYVEQTGRPLHSSSAIAQAYACTLQSWLACLTRSLSETVPDRQCNSPEPESGELKH